MSRSRFVMVLLALVIGSLSVQALEHGLTDIPIQCDDEAGTPAGLRDDGAYHLSAEETCQRDAHTAPTVVSAGPTPAAPEVGKPTPVKGFVRAGPLSDPNFFPIGVWRQEPVNGSVYGEVGRRYKDMGVNLLVGLSGSYTRSQEMAIPEGMWVLPDAADATNPVANTSPKVVGYVVSDEPDMNVRPEGCLLPADLKARAAQVRAVDPTRPIYVNFGKGFALPDFYHGVNCPYPGVSRDHWNGEADFLPDQHHQTYLDWAAIPDIASVDFYPINDPWEPEYNKTPEAIGRALRRTRHYVEATNPGRPVWAFIEVTDIDGADEQRKPTLAEVTVEVQQAWDNGANGITYFAHCFNNFREACLLDDPNMVQHLTKLNAQMKAGRRPIG